MTHARKLTLLTLGLTLFGLLMIGSASVVDAARDFGDKLYYVKLQGIWALLGLSCFVIFSKIDHSHYLKLAFPMFVVTVLLLVAVILPGVGTRLLGARRWLNLGLFLFQPSEMAKITLAVYFSALLAAGDRFGEFISALGLVFVLVVMEPDLGTALVLTGMALVVYFTAVGKISRLLILGVVGGFFLVLVIATSSYRLKRFMSFLNYSSDPLGTSYQINQSLVALKNGGIFGLGLGQSRQKYNYLPEAATDSIFAIIAEELGLFGSALLLVSYLLFISEGLKVAAACKSQFSANLAVGLTSIIGFQAFINISAISALVPLTGIPLNYISYGGSSLVIMLIIAGVLVNISKKYASR
jgi:cell division protein FtsW